MKTAKMGSKNRRVSKLNSKFTLKYIWAVLFLSVVLLLALHFLHHNNYYTPLDYHTASDGLLAQNSSAPVFIKGYANIYFFWQEGCPHCHAEWQFLKNISSKYPVRIYSFEVRDHPENRSLYFKSCSIFDTKPLGTPMTFIGSSQLVGFGDSSFYTSEIIDNIERCVNHGCYDKLAFLSNTSNPSISSNLPNPLWANSSTSDSCSGSSVCSLPVNTSSSSTLSNTSKRFITVPILGRLDTSKISLPLFTVVIAGLDGFNPCAMWVLTFLLTLLVYSGSKKKMLFVGLVFVFSSALIYFLFMTAWLNLFLLVGYTKILRILVGIVAVVMGIVDIKDGIWFKKGISFTIPDSAKPKLFKKMREVVNKAKNSDVISLPVVIGTITLAVTANLIEFACTAGFPAIYTRVLTLRHLPVLSYYLYLVLYNIIYVIPLLVIVLVFSLTLGAHKFSKRSGKIMKLIGGLLMFILGLLLIFKPQLLILR